MLYIPCHAQTTNPYLDHNKNFKGVVLAGISAGADDAIFSAPKGEGKIEYDAYLLKPYAGIHLGIMPLFALGVNTGANVGVRYKFVFVEAGLGRTWLGASGAKSQVWITGNAKLGLDFNYVQLKAGPIYFLKPTTASMDNYLEVNNQAWTFTLIANILEIEKAKDK
jgi:hypothetical protein